MSCRCVILAAVLSSTAIAPWAAYAQFDEVTSWATFDAGANDLGNDPDGYEGAVFDGRYVYFAPGFNGTEVHGEVMRYDTLGDFAASASWAVYDLAAHGIGYRPRGYRSPTFDGRYVYFAPFHNGLSFHGEVLRYDTTGDFESTSSWMTYDAGSHGVGTHPDGYCEAVFDGRYVYFVPLRDTTEPHGEVLRYDTTGAFNDVASWTTYEPGIHGVGTRTAYSGGVYDGRYVYFVPVQDDLGAHGEVLRYDTTGGFADVSAWAAYDPGEDGVGDDPDGFSGAVFDGRYVYFVPLYDGSAWSGEILRYDTTTDFSLSTSWTTYDPGDAGLGGNADGFAGGAFDGRYVYFSPHSDEIPGEDEVLRYDTRGSFTDLSSWMLFDPPGAGVGSGVDGRYGAVFDGRYVYFPLANFNQETHGEVLRYDTAAPEPIPTVSEWGTAAMLLLLLTAGTVVITQTWRRSGHV
jgi:hypothetical protein